MVIHLLRSPNVVYECAMLFYNHINGNACRDLKLSVQKKSNIEQQVLDSCFDAIINLTESIYQARRFGDNKAEYLFKRHEELDGCFAFYILHDTFRLKDTDFNAALEHMKSISRAHFFVNLYSLLLKRFPNTDSSGVVSNYSELINFIGALPISAELKWELCSFYNSFDTHKDSLIEIISETGRQYQAMYDSVKHYCDWFATNYEESAGEYPEAYLASNYGVSLDNTPDALYIVPAITSPAETRYLMNYTGDEENDFLYVGVLFDPLRGFEDTPADAKRLFRAIRALGDASKFEIVRLLGEAPRYGQQLAELLEISTATISHHMAQLIELDLVKTERDANRVYYSINEGVFRAIANDFTRLFTK